MILILLVYRKYSLIRQFPTKMKESKLTVKIFCGQITQVTKKREGVCMYYKENLSIIKREVLGTLKECLVREIIVG